MPEQEIFDGYNEGDDEGDELLQATLQNLPFPVESAAVDAAAETAVRLIRDFAERDNDDDVWKRPEDMLNQIAKARDKVTEAWEKLDQAMKDSEAANRKEQNVKPYNEMDFRAAYMDMITDAFADVLEDLRQKEGDALDVDVLVDCLQSGIDLMTQEDKEFFLMSETSINNDDNDETSKDDNEDGKLTPHELRRRQLGFHIEPTSA